MNIWRMKLRSGSHGPDMLPVCRARGIAAITYEAVWNTDLTRLTKADLDSGVKGSARGSMFSFAWEIQGGDEILVGDSISKRIEARGYVMSPPGQRAYRFNDRNPVTEPNNPNAPWKHEIPVAWDSDFEPFAYRDGAPQHTVMRFDPAWIQQSEVARLPSAVSAPEIDSAEAAHLSEESYMRKTRASQRNVERLHAGLSNRFRNWVSKQFAVRVDQERNSIDVRFTCNGVKHLAELKICYGGNTRAAIREAMGQLLEYNHYPPRSEAQFWWLVLDHHPARADRAYIDALRSKYALPLTLAWSLGANFESYPKLSGHR